MEHANEPPGAGEQLERLPIGYVVVRDFMRVQLVALKPKKTGVTIIRGRNGQGKSAVLRGFTSLLQGQRATPAKPIREGAEYAEVVAEIGMLRVVRKWRDPEDRSKFTLTIENLDGSKVQRPQEYLDGLLRSTVDPVALLRMKPAELVGEALRLVEVPLDLEAHKGKMRIAEDRRRDAGKDLERQAAEVQAWATRAEGAPSAPVDVAAIAQRIEQATKAQAAKEAAQQAVRNAQIARDGAAAKVENLKRQLEDAENEVRAKALLLGDAERALGALGATPDVTEDRVALSRAAELNQRYRDRERLTEEVEKRQAAEREVEEAVAMVQRLRDEREAALKAAKWPNPGLGLDPDAGTLTLDGVPFEQASMAQRLIAACDIAMAKPSPIRALMIQDGSILDAEHLALLNEHLVARGWQAFAEIVGEEPSDDGLWIEDGRGTYGDVPKEDR